MYNNSSIDSHCEEDPRIEARRNFLKGLSVGLIGLGFAGCASLSNSIEDQRTEKFRARHKEIYEKYGQFKFNYASLTSDEVGFLDQIHKEYGSGPVDADDYLDGAKEDWIKNFKYISGKDELSDSDLIFILENMPQTPINQ